MIFVLARAATYSALFIGFLLVFLPDRILARTGITQPAAIGGWQIAGIIVGAAGAALAVACILTFVFVGRGTPAPFDPPRKLVVRGPYRFVRNPMYLGAVFALSGAASFYQSLPLLGYAGVVPLRHVAVRRPLRGARASGRLSTETTRSTAGASAAGGPDGPSRG